MRRLVERWRQWRASRPWQRVYRAEPGWYIVLSDLGPGTVIPEERWEVELTSPEGHTRLYYWRSRRAGLRHLRSMGIKPRRERSTRR